MPPGVKSVNIGMLLNPGSRLGPYEIVAMIGSGGMGEVYKARDTRLDRTVAIKIAHEQFSQRFEREARAVAALNHPNICTLYDVGPNYLVMEYIEGDRLKGPLPLEKTLEYAVQIAGALEAAHRKGIVHRDLKPANILVTKLGLKLLDFSIAKVAVEQPEGDATVTLANPLTTEYSILGTLRYMAPEQLEGKAADARSDIFACGLMLYEMIVGKHAVQAANQAGLIAAILKEEPPSLPRTHPSTPAALDRVVRKCLRKDPDARWQTAADLRDELEWIARSPPELAPSTPLPTPKARGWMLAAALAAALAIALASLFAWQFFRMKAPPDWAGLRLRGPAVAFFPRVSPDGQLVAFLTIVDGLTQLAVMKADGSSWTLLTQQKGLGYIANLAWAPDGSTLYFDRFWDTARGVYSVPALGGDPRLIIDDAFAPEVLPDRSLIVAKPVEGQYQLYRFWPESGRSEALPAFQSRNAQFLSIRAVPDSNEIVFSGAYSTAADHSGPHKLYALDLVSHRARLLDRLPSNWSETSRPAAIAADGKSVITVARRDDLIQVVKIPRDGTGVPQVLLSFPINMFPQSIDVGRDGSIYVDSVERPRFIIRFPSAGGFPEQIAEPDFHGYAMLPLADGSFLYPLSIGVKQRLVIARLGAQPRPFLQTNEDSVGPMTRMGNGNILFLLGPLESRRIAVASLREGRILQRLSVPAGGIRSMAASPDGRTLYYASGGAVWSAATEGNATPRRLLDGDDVAIDPAGRYLYVKQLSKDPAAMVRLPAGGGPEEPLPFAAGLHLTTDTLSSTCVDARGRIVVEVATPDSFFYRPALLDAARKSPTPIQVTFDGDIWGPVWTPDGRIAAVGARFEGSIWRYRQSANGGH